jgi:hypothetical protein
MIKNVNGCLQNANIYAFLENILYIYNMNKLKKFFSGYVSAFDIWGNSIAVPDFSCGFERDSFAFKHDWQKIGLDIGKSMERIVLNGK